MPEKLYKYLLGFYNESDFPSVRKQIKIWSETKPLRGIRVLDATPVFRNTMLKYTALIAAGADLTAVHHPNIPADPEILKLLPEFGIKIHDGQQDYDVIADCAGYFRNISSRYGYAELTRSGLHYYQDAEQPVFSVDSGLLKRFETTLGTGESYLRAMRKLGYSSFAGKRLLIFGGGKVGQGIAWYAAKEKMQVTIADKAEIPVQENISVITESSEIRHAVRSSDYIVSVTGLKDALAEWAQEFAAGSAVIANMGVEDEFGTNLPPERVLNNKMPLNFILEEPTLLRYIDPVFALSNYGLNLLIQQKIPAGINLPQLDFELELINDLRHTSIRDEEIEFILNSAAPFPVFQNL